MHDDERADSLYRWTIRSLYVTALVLNAWVLWDQVKDSEEGQRVKQRAEQLAAKVMHPIKQRSLFRKQANQVVFEAVTIVEGSTDGDNGS